MINQRDAVVAGRFYPDDPKILQPMVMTFLRGNRPALPAAGVVVPHAGYVYSGKVAGEVLSSVEIPRLIILLGPNHTGHGAPLALAPESVWKTPLGDVPVDKRLTELLAERATVLSIDPVAHRFEHSLEVVLPFLQVCRSDCRIAAICVGTQDVNRLIPLGYALADVVQSISEPILLVASSDMSHYISANAAAVQDQAAIDCMLAVDAMGLLRVVHERDISMCGAGPAAVVLSACKNLGVTHGELVRYTNSGEVSGDFDQVVGYAGLRFSKAAVSM